MFKKLAKGTAGVILGVTLFGSMATASPTTGLISPLPQTKATSSLYQEAQVDLSIGFGTGYDQRRDGNRCRYRSGNCNQFYQGYYYESPWWLDSQNANDGTYYRRHHHFSQAQFGYRRGSNHSAWCAQRYRSYDADSDSFMGNDGRNHVCISFN